MMTLSRASLFLLFGLAACGGESTPPLVLTTLKVTLSAPSLPVGQSATATVTGTDQNGGSIATGTVTWASTNPGVATIAATGTVTAVSAGTTEIIATAGGKAGQASLTVTGSSVTCAASVRPALGEIRAVTQAEAAGLCITATNTAAEYVIVAFNNSNVASNTTPFEVQSTNTISVTASPNLGVFDASLSLARPADDGSLEAKFRARELAELGSRTRPIARGRASSSSQLIPPTMTEGSIVAINSDLAANLCTGARVEHPARLVALRSHVMIFVDTLAPAGGFTDTEIAAFADLFNSVTYAMDESNFGAVSDRDGNTRIVVYFTTGVNTLTSPSGGGFIGGVFTARDLIDVKGTDSCPASNEAEMVYLPVPDPNRVLNGNYTNKTLLTGLVASTLAHEFQHLINASRRFFVQGVFNTEQTWLNEGLSHIAEELLFYQVSGLAPRANNTADNVRITQAAVDAFNANAIQNFGRLLSYFAAPHANSPFEPSGNSLETRGAIWQLLRYAADRKGGNERDTWQALVNTTTTGQNNFNRVFGNIIEQTRDWAVAQFIDDIGLNPPARYTNLSWSFRSIIPAITTARNFPLATSQLIGGATLPVSLVGGGTSYIRFRVAANATASVTATASSQRLPANIDLILVRTF